MKRSSLKLHQCGIYVHCQVKLLFQHALSKILTVMNRPLLWKCLIPLTEPGVPVDRVKWKPGEQLPTRLFFSLFDKLLFAIKWFFRFKRLSRNTKIEASFHCQKFEKQTFHWSTSFSSKRSWTWFFPQCNQLLWCFKVKPFFSPSSEMYFFSWCLLNSNTITW